MAYRIGDEVCGVRDCPNRPEYGVNIFHIDIWTGSCSACESHLDQVLGLLKEGSEYGTPSRYEN